MTRDTWIRRLFFIGLAGALLATPGIHAQGDQQSPPTFPWAGQDAAIPYPDTLTPPAVNFDARDLTGVWLRRGRQALSDFLWDDGVPPKMTAAGMALFKESLVAVRNELVSVEEWAVNARPPIQGNDPIMQCDPYGFPRVLWDFNAPMEMGHLPNKIVQFFEWTAVWRTIWMDGRELPEDPDPRWMGYSVGRWEGDTLVVETVGLDERAWLDEFGHRHSGNGRFVERYRRVDARTMEYDATLFDPDFYTEPWVGTTRNFLLLPMEGWPQVGLREEFCAPSVEGDFNLTIRDPAGGKEQ